MHGSIWRRSGRSIEIPAIYMDRGHRQINRLIAFELDPQLFQLTDDENVTATLSHFAAACQNSFGRKSF
jgi:hypothetical protein